MKPQTDIQNPAMTTLPSTEKHTCPNLWVDKGKAFVWNSEDWHTLRSKHRICGALIGSVTSYPRQNDFLGLPMVLMQEEALLLVQKGICKLFDLPKLVNMPTEALKKDVQDLEKRIFSEQHEALKKRKIDEITQKIDIVIAGKKKKMLQKGLTNVEIDKDAYLQELINQIPELSPAHVLVHIPMEDFLETERIPASVEALDLDAVKGENKYEIFKDLWERGYHITCGSKFGCDYLVYPGDPVKFHASYMVRCVKREKLFNPATIVAFGRLAVGVNKSAVLAFLGAEGNVEYQTLQWHDSVRESKGPTK